MNEKLYNQIYDVLKEYHNKIGTQAKAGYVPQFCCDLFILELQKMDLQIVKTGNLK